jgi:SIR2-like domain/TIR domain
VSIENLQSREGDQPVGGAVARALKVFVNYRHEDTQGTAWALYFKLVEQFGEENVFFDHGTLRPGMQWLEEIKSHIDGAGVFLVLIGPKWMSSLNAHQQRGGEDFVANEIDLALRGGPRVTVLPVLVDEAPPPDASDLPPMLRALPACQVERLRGTQLQEDIEHLIAGLQTLHSGPPAAAPAPDFGRWTPIVERASEDRAPSAEQPDVASLDAAPQPRLAPPAAGRQQPYFAPSDGGQQPQVAPSHGGQQPRLAPRPDEDHYRMIARRLGNLVIFLGAGANAESRQGPWLEGSRALPDDLDLARYIAAKVKRDGATADLAGVAQYASAIDGEEEVFQWVRQLLTVDSEPCQIHERLARLPARLAELGLEKRHQMIVTSNYDNALEKAFKAAGEDFDVAVYMAPGTEEAGRFMHLKWDANEARPIPKPNDYFEFPITDDGQLKRTVIVRINGAVDDHAMGYRWEDNYVLTEDHYIDYFGGHSAEEVLPAQILAKLRRASYLFLAYTMADWRLRVFLQRIAQGQKLGRAKYWAVERDPDRLELELWRQAGVGLYGSRLTDYLQGLDDFLVSHVDELRP